MKNSKKLISLLLAVFMIFALALPAFAKPDAEPEEKTVSSSSLTEYDGEKAPAKNDQTNEPTSSPSVKVTKEKAENIALTAAKAKYAIEGVSGDVSGKAIITKLKYNKKTASYTVTVRAQRVHKYTCTISVKSFLSMEIGMPEDSQYVLQGKVGAFFGQGAEKFSYFFIRLFGQTGPKE